MDNAKGKCLQTLSYEALKLYKEDVESRIKQAKVSENKAYLKLQTEQLKLVQAEIKRHDESREDAERTLSALKLYLKNLESNLGQCESRTEENELLSQVEGCLKNIRVFEAILESSSK